MLEHIAEHCAVKGSRRQLSFEIEPAIDYNLSGLFWRLPKCPGPASYVQHAMTVSWHKR